MASPEERITMDYPVTVVRQPTSDGTVRGTPVKVTPAAMAQMREQIRREATDQ